MSLSEPDRQWIKDMIALATAESLNASRDFTRGMVTDHAKACPNIRKLKWVCLGLGAGLGLSGPQWIPALAKGVAGLFAPC